MEGTKQKLKEIKEDIIERKPAKITKRTSIIFDGRQYTIRIPRSFAEKAQIDPEKDEFEFELEMPNPEENEFIPTLGGELVEKETKKSKQ